MGSGQRQVVTGVAASQDLVVQKAQGRGLDSNGMRLDLLFETVKLVLADASLTAKATKPARFR